MCKFDFQADRKKDQWANLQGAGQGGSNPRDWRMGLERLFISPEEVQVFGLELQTNGLPLDVWKRS